MVSSWDPPGFVEPLRGCARTAQRQSVRRGLGDRQPARRARRPPSPSRRHLRVEPRTVTVTMTFRWVHRRLRRDQPSDGQRCVGVLFNYQITANISPTSFDAMGPPSGLT